MLPAGFEIGKLTFRRSATFGIKPFEIVSAPSSGATTVSFKKAVLSLEVTPHITPDKRRRTHHPGRSPNCRARVGSDAREGALERGKPSDFVRALHHDRHRESARDSNGSQLDECAGDRGAD